MPPEFVEFPLQPQRFSRRVIEGWSQKISLVTTSSSSSKVPQIMDINNQSPPEHSLEQEITPVVSSQPLRLSLLLSLFPSLPVTYNQ